MGSYQENEEAKLIRVIQVGDQAAAGEAFARLYDDNDPELRRYVAYRFGCKDLRLMKFACLHGSGH